MIFPSLTQNFNYNFKNLITKDSFMKFILLLLFSFSYLFSFETQVFWTAFKTYQKIGVSGTFDEVKTVGDKFENLKVKINTNSINSGNSGRDFTLVHAFWKVQKVDEISAEILKVEKKSVSVQIEMNGIQKIIKMDLEEDKNKISAKGVIELSDFEMLQSLHTINSTCYELHDGKTWSDIEIGFEIKE
jgi:hydrogenase maturation factor